MSGSSNSHIFCIFCSIGEKGDDRASLNPVSNLYRTSISIIAKNYIIQGANIKYIVIKQVIVFFIGILDYAEPSRGTIYWALCPAIVTLGNDE